MPATQQLIQCDHCRRDKTQGKMSVAGDICLECFDRAYRFCQMCGKVIGQTQCIYGRGNDNGTFFQDGLKLCYRCYTSADWLETNWRPTPTPWAQVSYAKIGSSRKFGVELETSGCPAWEGLRGNTLFGAKDDCTVDGKEFDSPVLYGDEGLDHLRELLVYAAQKEWTVDDACGCHTHHDVRDLCYEQLCSVTYAYRKSVAVWRALVDPNRLRHEYSGNYRWSCADFKRVSAQHSSYSELLNYWSRGYYEYVRFSSYNYHNTFENRMLEGCLDADTLCAWIKLNCRFIDAVKDMSFTAIDSHFGPGQRQRHFGPMCSLVDAADLTDWMRRRGVENGRPFDST